MPFRIAVAASDPEQRAWLQSRLESAGHCVVRLSDAEPLAALEPAAPDLIVAFHSAARLEGWSLCRSLRSAGQPVLNTVPVLLISADMVGLEAAQITRDLGGDGLLPYPIDGGRLLHEVDRLLGSRSQVRPAAPVPAAPFSIDTERLRESEAELAAAQRIAHIGSWQWNIRTDEARWSDETFRLFGLDRHALREHRTGFLHLVHGEDRERVNQALTDALNGTAEYDIEFRIERPDGTGRIVHSQGEVLRDEAGKPTLMRGTIHDITGRRRAEDALRNSEAKHRGLFEHMQQGVFYQRADGRLMDANPAALEMFGVSVEEFLQRRHSSPEWKVIDENGIPVCPCDYPSSKALATGVAIKDVVYAVFNPHRGEWRWLVVNAIPEFQQGNAEPYQVLVTLHDITARRNAEDALRTANQQVRMLADNLHEAVLAYDMDHRLIFVNQAVEDLTGYSVEEMRREHFICWIHPDDRDRMMAAWEFLFEGGSYTDLEYRLITKDGKQKWARASWGPLLNEAGEQVGVHGSERDITERKRAEMEKGRLEEQLRQAQKMESIGRLAGGVAHDFNNLLTVINGYSQLALDELHSDDPLRANLAEIQKAGERAAGLTRQLLAFSRKQVLQPRRLDLNLVVEEMRPMLERLMGESVEVRVEFDCRTWTVYADPHQLEQVIMNLSVNARDAMPDGGRLLIGTSEVERDGNYLQSHPEDRAGRYVMLAVSDTGVGMDEETRQQIFEPFFTTKGSGQGTGLGLSMVQGIVAQSGGYITVESEPGHGTTFRIYLPALAEAADEAEKPADTAQLGGGETVLVVEDQTEVRNYAVAVLEAYGYSVIQAENGREALALCEREQGRIHMVLTDVVMPDLGGCELADRLKEIRPGIKVLFMSGYTDDMVVRQGVLEEGVEFIQKPFTPKELAAKIRAILARPATES